MSGATVVPGCLSDYGPLMAASTLVVLPLLIAFLAAQRWFMEGLTGGAVK
jgi:multiple sugar transport system permease protein